jgi:hypothetical protein
MAATPDTSSSSALVVVLDGRDAEGVSPCPQDDPQVRRQRALYANDDVLRRLLRPSAQGGDDFLALAVWRLEAAEVTLEELLGDREGDVGVEALASLS